MRIKTLLTALTAMLTVFVPIFAPLSATAATKSPYYFGAWIPFWQSQPGQQDIAIHLDSLDEVSPFSYRVRTDGTLIDDLKIGDGKWFGWLTAVHDGGVKILPTVAWFDGGDIYNLLSSGTKRRALEDTVKNLVKTQKFDGIDIDFEGMVAATKPYFSLFIQGLALRLHPLGKKVACTVTARMPADSLYGGVESDSKYTQDYVELNKYCDEIRVMAYDQQTIDTKLNATKGNGNLYAPVADPDWAEKVIKETLKTVSAKKVMLGVPTYGYEYQVSWANGITKYERVRSFNYMDAMDRADEVSTAPARNNAGELTLMFASTTYVHVGPAAISTVFSTMPAALMNPNPNATTTFFISFPDAQSTLSKINLVKKYKLRGIILFKADGEMDPAIWEEMK